METRKEPRVVFSGPWHVPAGEGNKLGKESPVADPGQLDEFPQMTLRRQGQPQTQQRGQK